MLILPELAHPKHIQIIKSRVTNGMPLSNQDGAWLFAAIGHMREVMGQMGMTRCDQCECEICLPERW